MTSPASVPAPSSGADAPAPGQQVRAIVALLVVALSFLPVANWIAGGFSDAEYVLQRSEWISGSAIVLGIGVALAILSRSIKALWRPLVPGAIDARAERWWPWAVGTIAVAGFALSALVAHVIFGRQSQLIDEMAQTIQARIFAGGHLTAPIPALPEFFSTQHMLAVDGRVFSQFPPGGPAAIALGILVGAEWLVGPAFGLVSVLAFAAYLRRTGERPGVALLALALFALGPMTFFMGGSRMNHVMTTTFVLLASLALVTAARSASPRPLLAFLCGLCYGTAATFRPVDAAAFALPGGTWLMLLAARDRRRFPDLVLSGLGVALPLAFMFWFNAQTTGEPTLFGYQMLWGRSHDLGFHPAPWGAPHTPARGLELVSIYFSQLQRHFLETPLPSLLPALVAFALARRTTAADRYLLVGSGIVVGAYFAYWHAGKFLGPRFFFPLLPVLAIWTARFPSLFREWLARRGSLEMPPTVKVPVGATVTTPAAGAAAPKPAARPLPLVWRGATYVMIASALVAVAYAIPMRWRQYDLTFRPFRWDAAASARAHGVRNALVFVREGWESNLVVRLWHLGVSHPAAELYYRSIDACRLDGAIAALENASADSTAVHGRLRTMLPDSIHVRTARLESGFNVRVQEGAPYSAHCQARIAETNAGVLALSPLMAGPPDGNVYARDLHARDSLLMQRHPERPVYLLRPQSADRTAPPVFIPLRRDSLLASWRAEASRAR